jgi:uncharacterized protein (DUF111 family)
MVKIIFRQTTSFGLRYQRYYRKIQPSKFIYKHTQMGKIKFRAAGDDRFKQIPEYSDCLTAAKQKKIPVIDVYRIQNN